MPLCFRFEVHGELEAAIALDDAAHVIDAAVVPLVAGGHDDGSLVALDGRRLGRGAIEQHPLVADLDHERHLGVGDAAPIVVDDAIGCGAVDVVIVVDDGAVFVDQLAVHGERGGLVCRVVQAQHGGAIGVDLGGLDGATQVRSSVKPGQSGS